MSGYVPPTGSPYAAGDRSGPVRLPWHRVLVRLVLVVVPGQVVGALIATLLVIPVDLRAHPHVAALFWVLPGIVAGVALAVFLLRPEVERPWSLVGAAAVVGAVAVLGLVLLGGSRVPGAALADVLPALLGGLVGCVVIQTVVAVGLWALRRRTRSTA